MEIFAELVLRSLSPDALRRDTQPNFSLMMKGRASELGRNGTIMTRLEFTRYWLPCLEGIQKDEHLE